jgi:hypothetical protein
MTTGSDVWRYAILLSILLIAVSIVALLAFDVVTGFRLVAIVVITCVWTLVLLMLYVNRPKPEVDRSFSMLRTLLI